MGSDGCHQSLMHYSQTMSPAQPKLPLHRLLKAAPECLREACAAQSPDFDLQMPHAALVHGPVPAAAVLRRCAVLHCLLLMCGQCVLPVMHYAVLLLFDQK